MSRTHSTLEETSPPKKPGALLFVVLMVLGAIVGVFAVLRGEAPPSLFPVEDWINWVRIPQIWGAVFSGAVAVFAIGFIGLLLSLILRPRSSAPKVSRGHHVAEPVQSEVSPVFAEPATEMAFASPADDYLHVPSSEGMSFVPQQRPETRGSLKFDAQRLSTAPSDGHAVASTEAPYLFAEDVAASSLHSELQSLEPAVFHDNASDSFFTRPPVTPEATPEVTQPSPAHWHEASDAPAAMPSVTSLDPNMPAEPGDPLEIALLAEPVNSPPPAPQSDINAVISSARRFIEPLPEPAHAAEPVVVEEPVAEPVVMVSPVAEPFVIAAPTAETVPAPETGPDAETEIREAVQTALSVWPDATRGIAAEELSVRIANLYRDPDPQSHNIFQLIASGDLSAAAAGLHARADVLAHEGRTQEAAELWRVQGALHMGRDDARALAAYAHVSELDAADANIHLYLARRYQMSGDTAKLPAVIERALNVISDPAVRTELLIPYADLHMKAGHVALAADALAELTGLHETTALLRPDDISALSAYAISLARLAQAREMQGAFDQAATLYKKAHQVFADLSARKPEHPGLRAMAETALKDAQRFGG